MAYQEDMLLHGVLTRVTKFDHSAQEIDDAAEIAPSHASRHASGGADPITPNMIGAVPIIIANSADYDMDAILTGGAHYAFYKTGANALNTPYKLGLTTLNAALILSFSSSANYGYQIAFISGRSVPYMRFLNNGTISDWTDGYLSVAGGTLTGDLTIEDSTPNLLMNDTASGGRLSISFESSVAYIGVRNVADNSANRRQILIRSSAASTSDLTNAVAFRDVVDGDSTIYRLYGNHNLVASSTDIEAGSALTTGQIYQVYE